MMIAELLTPATSFAKGDNPSGARYTESTVHYGH